MENLSWMVKVLVEAELSWLGLHAGLFRICQENLATLTNHFASKEGREHCFIWVQRANRLLAEEVATRKLGTSLLQEFLRGENRGLLACAGILKALDQRNEHLKLRRGERVRLPADLGGGDLICWPPAPSPRLGDGDNIPRTILDARNDLASLLALSWRFLPHSINGLGVRLQELEGPLASELRRVVARGHLCIGMAAPSHGFDYQFTSRASETAEKGTPFRFVSLKPDTRACGEATIESILAACAEEEVDILMLPELTLDEDLLTFLSRKLGFRDTSVDYPCVVVAGSFHHQDPSGGWRNRAYLLDGAGKRVFCHDKLLDFRLTPHDLQKAPNLGPLMGLSEAGGHEDILRGEAVTLIDTPLGRLSLLICLDYCGDILREVVVDHHANLFLVPAMTSQMDIFHETARRLGQMCRASSFVVNSAWLLDRIGLNAEQIDARRHLCYLPFRPARGEARQPKIANGCAALRVFNIDVLSSPRTFEDDTLQEEESSP